MLAVSIFIYMLSIVTSPEVPVQGAKEAVDTCLKTIVPSLFPVFVLNNILIKSGTVTCFCNRYLKWFSYIFKLPPASAAAIILGIVSGYPVGIKVAGDLYENRDINLNQYKHLSAFCANAGPAFITGAVGIGMFHSARIGLLLLTIHIISSFVVGILFCLLPKSSVTQTKTQPVLKRQPISSVFTDSVESSIKTVAYICGYIIFFGTLTAYLQNILRYLPEIASSVITGFIEMTNGVITTSSSALPLNTKLTAVSGIIGWGGICVHAQSLSFLKYKKSYFLGKAMQGVISSAITYIILSIIPS